MFFYELQKVHYPDMAWVDEVRAFCVDTYQDDQRDDLWCVKAKSVIINFNYDTWDVYSDEHQYYIM